MQQPVRKALDLVSLAVLMLVVARVFTGGYTGKVSVWVLTWAGVAAIGTVFIRARARERRAAMSPQTRAPEHP